MLRSRLLLCPLILLATTSCGEQRQYLYEKYTGERTGDRVAGPRRAPVLNPKWAVTESGNPRGTPPRELITPAPRMTGNRAPVLSPPQAVPPNEQQAEAEPTLVEEWMGTNSRQKPVEPYDMYDASGNQVVGGQKNYIAEWLGLHEEAKRKSFEANQQGIVTPQQTAPTATIEPVVPIRPMPAPMAEPMIVPEEEPAPAAPIDVPQTPPRVAPNGNGVMIPRADLPTERKQFAYNSQYNQQLAQLDGVQLAQLAPAAGSPTPEPSLADVPPRPQALDRILATKDAQKQQLLDAHEQAGENKEKLDAEPTGLSPTSLPVVEDTLEDIKSALESPHPIVTASAAGY